jgi:hypothetical protein
MSSDLLSGVSLSVFCAVDQFTWCRLILMDCISSGAIYTHVMPRLIVVLKEPCQINLVPDCSRPNARFDQYCSRSGGAVPGGRSSGLEM